MRVFGVLISLVVLATALLFYNTAGGHAHRYATGGVAIVATCAAVAQLLWDEYEPLEVAAIIGSSLAASVLGTIALCEIALVVGVPIQW